MLSIYHFLFNFIITNFLSYVFNVVLLISVVSFYVRNFCKVGHLGSTRSSNDGAPVPLLCLVFFYCSNYAGVHGMEYEMWPLFNVIFSHIEVPFSIPLSLSRFESKYVSIKKHSTAY